MNIRSPINHTEQRAFNRAKSFIQHWGSDIERCLVLAFLFVSARGFSQTNNQLPPLAPPHGELPPTFWEQNGKMILIAGIILIILLGLIIWKLLQPKPVVVLPPATIAREALKQLANQPEDGRLLSQTSQILRRYIGATFGFPGGEMTTTEFCSALARFEKLDLQLGEAICEFLRKCDTLKFSAASAESSINAVDQAREFIARIEQQQTANPA